MSKKKLHRVNLDDEGMGVDLTERIAVLDAMRANYDSRLLATAIPQEQIALAEKLEKQAEELYDKAQRIRKTLLDDTTNKVAIENERDLVLFEIVACQACRNNKLRPTRAMLNKLVAQIADDTRRRRLIVSIEPGHCFE